MTKFANLKAGDEVIIRSWERDYTNGKSVISKYEPKVRKAVIESIGRKYITIEGDTKFLLTSGYCTFNLYTGYPIRMFLNESDMEAEDKKEAVFKEIQSDIRHSSASALGLSLEDVMAINEIINKGKQSK